MKEHPVFIAQHRVETCCWECLFKWHKIEKNKKLTLEEEKDIGLLIMCWIKKEYANNESQ